MYYSLAFKIPFKRKNSGLIMNKKTRTNHDELESLFFNLHNIFTLNDKFVLKCNGVSSEAKISSFIFIAEFTKRHSMNFSKYFYLH